MGNLPIHAMLVGSGHVTLEITVVRARRNVLQEHVPAPR